MCSLLIPLGISLGILLDRIHLKTWWFLSNLLLLSTFSSAGSLSDGETTKLACCSTKSAVIASDGICCDPTVFIVQILGDYCSQVSISSLPIEIFSFLLSMSHSNFSMKCAQCSVPIERGNFCYGLLYGRSPYISETLAPADYCLESEVLLHWGQR